MQNKNDDSVVSVTVRIVLSPDKEINLSIDEAKRLKQKLDSLLAYEVFHPCPYPVWPVSSDPMYPKVTYRWETTTSNKSNDEE